MPRSLENILKQAAAAKGFTGRQADRYTYGALNNEGMMQGNVETPKGARADAKHVAKVSGAQHPHRNLGKFLHAKKAR